MIKILYTDGRIVEDLKRGNEAARNAALKHLYTKYFNMAKGIVLSKNGNEDDAADVFQDALIQAYENIINGSYRGDSSLKTYLYAIVRNIWVSRLKKEKITIGTEFLNEMTNYQPWLEPSDQEDVSDLLESAFNGLGEGCRKLLSLFYYHKFSMKEIRTAMSFSDDRSAKVQKYKCMQKLIRLLDGNPSLKARLSESYHKTNL